MTGLIAVIGVFFVLVGLTGLVQPYRFRSTIGAMDSRPRFISAVVIRLLMGALLWWLADELRHPQVMRVLAIIAVAAAVVILVAGQARLDSMVRWWLGKPDSVLRISATFAALFGAWLAWEAA
jgi:hypothetical protein